jgi:hypothetical protein
MHYSVVLRRFPLQHQQQRSSEFDMMMLDQVTDDNNNKSLKIWYCICGLGDLVARAKANQRYKINGTLNVVFCS